MIKIKLSRPKKYVHNCEHESGPNPFINRGVVPFSHSNNKYTNISEHEFLSKHDCILNGNALYARRISEEFEEIRRFLEQNPSEVVIIDLNGNWFEMDDALYDDLEWKIMDR